MKVIKFGAVWCPGCIIMKPRWKQIEEEHPWLETEYFDYDDDPEMVEKYNIGNDIPVFIFLDKNGEEFHRLKGEQKKDVLLKIILENKEK